MGAQGYGYGVGRARVYNHRALAVAKGKFRRKYTIFKTVYKHLFELDSECVGKAYEQLMGKWTRGAHTLKGDSYRLSLGRAYHHRYAPLAAVLGKHKSIGAGLQLAVRQAEHMEADSLFHR